MRVVPAVLKQPPETFKLDPSLRVTVELMKMALPLTKTPTFGLTWILVSITGVGFVRVVLADHVTTPHCGLGSQLAQSIQQEGAQLQHQMFPIPA